MDVRRRGISFEGWLILAGLVVGLMVHLSFISWRFGAIETNLDMVQQASARIERSVEHEVEDIEIRLREVEGSIAVLRAVQGKQE